MRWRVVGDQQVGQFLAAMTPLPSRISGKPSYPGSLPHEHAQRNGLCRCRLEVLTFRVRRSTRSRSFFCRTFTGRGCNLPIAGLSFTVTVRRHGAPVKDQNTSRPAPDGRLCGSRAWKRQNPAASRRLAPRRRKVERTRHSRASAAANSRRIEEFAIGPGEVVVSLGRSSFRRVGGNTTAQNSEDPIRTFAIECGGRA